MQKYAQQKFRMKSLPALTKFTRMKIKDIVEKTKCFSIIADEVTERYSNKEILLLRLRYLNINCKIGVPTIEETFLDSNYIQGTAIGKVIGNHILKLLADHGFNVKDCRGQAYVMSISYVLL